MNKQLNWILWIALALAGIPSQTNAFYDPAPQRWINRDPIGERGGAHLHGFVRNKPVESVDRNGLDGVSVVPRGKDKKAPACGTLCQRATNPNSIPVPGVGHISDFLSGLITPHVVVVGGLPGQPGFGQPTFSYPTGTDPYPNHWTTRCTAIIVLVDPERSCDDFWQCMRTKDWGDKNGRYNWWNNNCQTFAPKAIADCGGRLGNWSELATGGSATVGR